MGVTQYMLDVLVARSADCFLSLFSEINITGVRY